MNSLEPAELAALQADLNANLPSTCTVQNKELTRTPGGGYDDADGTPTSYRCRKGRAYTAQKLVDGLLVDVVRWPLYLESGATVDIAQTITLGGDSFEVVRVGDGDVMITPRVEIERFL